MAETAMKYDNPELMQRRLLTEVGHFLEYMDANGEVPSWVVEDVEQNRATAVQEIAMPYAVTETDHEIVERIGEAGRRERIILWMGKTVVESAMNGSQFHFSRAALRRTPIEVAEANRNQNALRPGVVQSMISPKMTSHDASEALARAEHLFVDDAIRTSTAITNENGEVIGRRLKSLLVRHIPFSAWVKMLKDPRNIFGKAFSLRDEESAASVMELFAHMDLPEDKLPEGPVSIVEAVLPYIDDQLARQKVKRQLNRFRGDQELYAREAKLAGKDWAKFDLELARSLQQGSATDSLRFFIMHNADAWNNESLATIASCELGNTQYRMTWELAALLARAKQKLVGDELAVVTENDGATEQVSSAAQFEIRTVHRELTRAREMGADLAYVQVLESRQYSLLHRETIRSGGGCVGGVASAFGRDGQPMGVGEQESPFKTSAESRSGWAWKQGVCQVKSCPSPKPTEVGPCNVCRRCQREFDAGRDPTKHGAPSASTKALGSAVVSLHLFRDSKKPKRKSAASAKLLTAA